MREQQSIWACMKKNSHKSFMIKHHLDKHESEPFSDERFMIKVLHYTRTSFERQIRESVIIQEENKKHVILNSK